MSESNPAPKAAEAVSAAPIPGATASKPPSKPIKPQNPVFKMMGLPRMRLPSRNWTIFLALSTSLAGAIIYDKRETKRAQKKWCKLVEHLALEPITDHNIMPRKLRVFLEAPPGDGLRIAQDHFKEYVKPVLVASGVDWEFVQGRREGDIRAEVAERIRTERKGGVSGEIDNIQETRRNAGVKEFDGINGDIVIGRHTWKEYVRGIHEGWLGPLEAPQLPNPTEGSGAETTEASEYKLETSSELSSDGSSTESEPPALERPAEEKDKPAIKLPPSHAYISPSEYSSASLSGPIPSEFDPANPIPFPHILGFFNTPTRLQRFLTRRKLADTIGRDVAAIILSTYRPYSPTTITSDSLSSFIGDDASSVASTPSENGNDATPAVTLERSEVSEALIHEEKDWDKSVFNPPAPKPVEGKSVPESLVPEEKIWKSPITTDPRIASRMRKPELSPEDEERVQGIVVKEEEIEGTIKGGLRWVWKWGTGSLPKEFGPDDIDRRNESLFSGDEDQKESSEPSEK